MKLVYFGTGTFAVPALRRLAEHISLVVAQPDRPSGRGMKLHPSPVKQAAMELGIPVETPEKARGPEFVERLQAEQADALLVASYGQILSQKVLDSARIGGINLHGSILPKYRGAAPIQRAILEGESETGITLMQMDKGMDTGDMISVVTTPIGPDETYGELQDRLAVIASDMAAEWMPRIVAGDYERTPQDNDAATMAAKIEKAECELVTDREAQEEYNRFRAFTPGPGAFMRTQFGLLKISQARLGTETGEPGVVLSTGTSCQVAFARGSLHLLEVQPEGKKRMSGKDFANGMRLRPGTALI
ncbi:MAG: methionyl-tRNA formyltransferase [Armatimonadetes bacterium 55-13]|nr:methionyl-tRNA formyltransferase [Armatimonadota bacterium]OJU63984.1 MAG: methionyl-tRNA formyltransferase [Armatimonadetes bacterium 55-13]